MQKWPFTDFKYLNVEHFRPIPQTNEPDRKWEHLTLEAVFPSESPSTVMFFDHFANQFKSDRSELDEYLKKPDAGGWKLTFAGEMYRGKSYVFRRLQFRRAVD